MQKFRTLGKYLLIESKHGKERERDNSVNSGHCVLQHIAHALCSDQKMRDPNVSKCCAMLKQAIYTNPLTIELAVCYNVTSNMKIVKNNFNKTQIYWYVVFSFLGMVRHLMTK